MKTLKLLCWYLCFAFFIVACSKGGNFNENEGGVATKSQFKFLYHGQEYCVAYEIVDSIAIYDEQDSATKLYLQLQNNPNLSLLVEKENQPILVFDNSDAMIAYVTKQEGKIVTKAAHKQAVMKATATTTQTFTIYSDANYGGYSVDFSVVYSYSNEYLLCNNLATVNQYPILNPQFLSFNDAISSFRSSTLVNDFDNYTHVVFYENSNYGGKSISFAWGTSVANFQSYTMKSSLFSKTTWNDQASSIKLLRQR